ncbi:17184_t:CDS:2, partial [Funneliformis caledonium]
IFLSIERDLHAYPSGDSRVTDTLSLLRQLDTFFPDFSFYCIHRELIVFFLDLNELNVLYHYHHEKSNVSLDELNVLYYHHHKESNVDLNELNVLYHHHEESNVDLNELNVLYHHHEESNVDLGGLNDLYCFHKELNVNLKSTSQSRIPIEDSIEDFIEVNEIELDDNSDVIIEQILSKSEEESDEFDIDEDIYFSEDEAEEEGRTINFDVPESVYSDEYPDISTANINQSFMWIVYWILKYHERYQLSDTVTNAL